MAHSRSPAHVRIDKQGRLVIPAALRERLHIRPGELLIGHVVDERLVLEKRAQVLERLRGRFAAVPNTTNLSEDLIRERRREARTELRGAKS